MAEFDDDLRRAAADLEAARTELLSVLEGLGDDDLHLSRRGGWPIRDVLLHVTGGELHHTNGIYSIRGRRKETGKGSRAGIATPDDAVHILKTSRNALMASLEGIDEQTFYALKPLLNEEGHGQSYSVLSVMENVALHDREHCEQIMAILEAHVPDLSSRPASVKGEHGSLDSS